MLFPKPQGEIGDRLRRRAWEAPFEFSAGYWCAVFIPSLKEACFGGRSASASVPISQGPGSANLMDQDDSHPTLGGRKRGRKKSALGSARTPLLDDKNAL